MKWLHVTSKIRTHAHSSLFYLIDILLLFLFPFYSNNKSRSLDCWKQVANFKEAVAEEQKKFIAVHQK